MRPYQVQGRTYVPRDDAKYDQKGIASWYGPGFHGKSTATGERFDQDSVTAAHKTLPLPSFVEVSNLDNGRVQLVRLNDRGPFVDDRIIDLSRRSAQLLGVDRTGIARVRVRRVYPSERQIAAITSKDAARTLAADAPKTVTTVTTITTRQPAPALEAPVPAPIEIAPPPPPAVRVMPMDELDSILAQPVAPATTGKAFVQVAVLSTEERAAALSDALRPIGPPLVDRLPSGLFRVRIGPFSASAAAEALARARAAGYEDARVVQSAR